MKTNERSKTSAITVRACGIATAMLLAFAAGCASTKATEDLLTAAGFKVKPATTAEQQAQIKALPARKISTIQKDGKQYYVFPDSARNIIYVGQSTEYQAYKQLRAQQELAEEQDNPAVQMQLDSALLGL